MPQLEVYCTVKNCDYWGQNNHCVAEKILICVDDQAAEWPNSIDAPMGATLPSAEADTCMQTACKTFRSRYSHAGPVQDQRDVNPALAHKLPHQ